MLILTTISCDASLRPFGVGDTQQSDGPRADVVRASDDVDGLRPGECRTLSDCPEGKVCSRGKPGCVDPECGMPPESPGLAEPGSTCSSASSCVAGYTCVSQIGEELLQQDNLRLFLYNVPVCMPACDPCRPRCPAGMVCIHLEKGPGGFCNVGPLAAEGEICRRDAVFCVAGTVCLTNICDRQCVPDGGESVFDEGATVAVSSDCTPGQLCFRGRSDESDVLSRIDDVCRTGRLVGRGERCDGRQLFCEPPDRCISSRCAKKDCDGGCPAGSECFGGVECIADGTVAYRGRCYETRNCGPGLVCMASSNTNIVYSTCVVPG